MSRALFQARYVVALFLGGAVLLAYFAIHAIVAWKVPRKAVVAAAVVDGLVALDVAFNLIVGTFLFWEWPRLSIWGWRAIARSEWMLTTRLKRLDREGAYGVEQIKVMLNALDPGHV